MRRILVVVQTDRCGNITARPVNTKYAKRFAQAVVDNGGASELGRLNVFFNQGNETHEFIEHSVPKRHRSALSKGYAVRWLEDPWTVGNWYGWDACHCDIFKARKP